MIALVSSAWVVPGLVGPALAGTVTDAIDWRWVFLGIVPPVLVMGLVVYPQLARARAGGPRRPRPRAATRAAPSTPCGWRSARRSLLAALTIGSLPLASRSSRPAAWLALGALRHLLPPGSPAPGARAARRWSPRSSRIGFAFFGTEAFVPLTVVEVRGGSVTLGGIALSAAAVTWAAASWLQARAAAAGIRRALVMGGAALIARRDRHHGRSCSCPDAPVLVAAAGWAVAGPGDGPRLLDARARSCSRPPTPGEEGFSSSALQLMFTLGTAFGAGIGGAIVAVAERGALELAPALGIVFGIMVVVALLTVGVSLRVPRGPSERQPAPVRLIPSGVPLEHP